MAVRKDKDLQKTVFDILSNFQGIEPLKELFWSVLNYYRINEPLSNRSWPDSLKNTMADNPLLLAGGGVDSDFHIIYCQLKSETLSRGMERPIVNQVLKEHPYNLIVFSNLGQTHWHFLNVKYDSDVKKRLLFRRITVSREELLRTACERISKLDLESVSPDLNGIAPLAIQNRCDEAFDVEAVTEEFYKKYEGIFQYVEGEITGIPDESRKRLFTQLFFNRLMFIAFIQKKGWLLLSEGNPSEYLQKLWEQYQKETYQHKNFYHDYLKNLFFYGFNDPVKKDTSVIELIGRVPYLNGGLFEKNKDDEDNSIIIPDNAIKQIVEDLFGRFNFTVMESTPLDTEVAIDPEMLGKVFEKLVTGRHETGSYYTPKSIVSFMGREALKNYLDGYELLVDEKNTQGIDVSEARKLLRKLSQIKVCDPACGSGAYLVGMLHEIHELTRLLDTSADQASARDDYQRKLEIIQNNLYGVDIDSFAVNIARLRMWLSLAVEYEGNDPPPLPNLDFKIEVGDSLTAPDPGPQERGIREDIIRQFQEKKAEYMRAHLPGEKQALYKEIISLRKSVTEWTHPDVDVKGFDWAVEFAEVFSSGGFDILLANPPYGIICEDPLRFQFFSRENGEEPQSKDSYGLFMARALQLLKTGAFFTFIVSDTWRTIRSHRPLRKRLLNETTVFHVVDLPSWVFEATVNTCILSLRKQIPHDEHVLIVGDLRNLPSQKGDILELNLLAIATHGPDIQTTTYSRYTYQQSLIGTYDNLSFFIGSPRLYCLLSDQRYTTLGDVADVKVGLQTGENKYYIRKSEGARGSYKILDKDKLLTEHEIDNLSEEEKVNGVNPAKYEGRHFVPYDKGGQSDVKEGWLPNYYVPTEYFIDWSKSSVRRMKTFIKSGSTKVASRFQNNEFYFKKGITFSLTCPPKTGPVFMLGLWHNFGS